MSQRAVRCERIEVVGGGTGLSVWVLTGQQDGPRGLICAGVHGDEFEGPRALQKLAQTMDPGRLKGTLLLVPVVNEGAFYAGTRCHPEDGKNLARVFPGRATGTVSERIAYTFVERLLKGSDFLVDLHSSGNQGRIYPWSGYGLVPGLIEAQRRMAVAFGLELVWGTPPNQGRTLSAAAELGIPSIYVEMPGEGRCHPDDVAQVERGVLNVLRSERMLPAEPDATSVHAKEPLIVETDEQHSATLELHHLAPAGGMFIPSVALGEWVERGDFLGELIDPAGRQLTTIHAEADGIVVRLRTFPVVAEGESLASLFPAPDVYRKKG